MNEYIDPHDGEPCRGLRVGDRIRITGRPAEWDLPEVQIDTCTRAIIDHLIAERAVVAVDDIDDEGVPWISYDTTEPDGTPGGHYLAVDWLPWERVDDPS